MKRRRISDNDWTLYLYALVGALLVVAYVLVPQWRLL
jgi:hypothetical protein